MSVINRFTKRSIFAAALAVGLASVAARADINFHPFTSPPPDAASNGTIGFAYAGDMFVGSVYHGGTNSLYSCDLTGGNVQLFAPTVNISGGVEEHFVSASLGLGGFANRDIYVADFGSITHITHDGSSGNVFASGFNGNVRGILFDSIGTFGYDMLVTTTSGDVYRVDSAGNKTVVASTGEDTEGLDVAPLGAGFGSYDGQLIVASENSNTIRAISPGGAVSFICTVAGGPEELTFVPLNLGLSGNPVEGFYGANFTPNVIKADAGEFDGMQGDVIVTSEFSHEVSRIHWNGDNFDVTHAGNFPNQPEDGIFVTAGLIPEPASLSMLLGLPILMRRRK